MGEVDWLQSFKTYKGCLCEEGEKGPLGPEQIRMVDHDKDSALFITQFGRLFHRMRDDIGVMRTLILDAGRSFNSQGKRYYLYNRKAMYPHRLVYYHFAEEITSSDRVILRDGDPLHLCIGNLKRVFPIT